MKENERRWYLTVIASLYLVLCSISVVRYAVIDFGSDGRTAPAMVQVLCLGMALAAGAYFVRPRVGHKGLILFTAWALVAIGTAEPKATCFHLASLCLLVLPYIRRQAHMSCEKTNEAAAPGL